MKLSYLTNNLDCKIIGKQNRDVEHLTHISSEAKPGSIFFCLKGKVSSGIDYLDDAIKCGCKIIVTEQSVPNKKITQIIVKDARKAMSEISSRFYGDSSKKLKIIGVTGTNGKTTTTNMIAHVLSVSHSVGIIGTSGIKFLDKNIITGFTTPDPIILHQYLKQMADSGVEYVVMEMSAHAIYLQKLWGIMPDIVCFTNLSQDHLDYFENMQNYYLAKAKLFEEKNYNHSVICVDTIYGEKLAKLAKNVTTCAVNKQADIIVKPKTHTIFGQTFDVNFAGNSAEFEIGVLGEFNLQNASVAISALKICGLEMQEISDGLKTFRGVEGRFETYNDGTKTIIIDYAHTPDGLSSLLGCVRQIAKSGKIYCVFGCGGNRDKDKRPLMGQISTKLADYTIITTDNPRFEDNYTIATEIASGAVNKKYQIILDRGQAIRQAVSLAKKGDIIVVAGKGAEDYIDVCGVKIDYQDKKLIEKLIK